MANGELAKKVEELQAKGAPDWGVSLYIEMAGLRSEFLAHCEKHEADKATGRFWGSLGEKILAAILVPMAVALAYGMIRFLATRLP